MPPLPSGAAASHALVELDHEPAAPHVALNLRAAPDSFAGAGCKKPRSGNLSGLLRASVPLLSLEDDKGLQDIFDGPWNHTRPKKKTRGLKWRKWPEFTVADLYQIRKGTRRNGNRLLLGGTCAVVGSSSSLWDEPRGAEIDGADVVIRANNAPIMPVTWGRCAHAKVPQDLESQRLCNRTVWAQHVGGRTDVYVNSGVVRFWEDNAKRRRARLGLEDGSGRSNGSMRLTYCPSRRVPWWGECFDQAVAQGYDVVSPSFEALVRREHCVELFPTMGLMATMVADALCSETRLYGFGRGRTSACASYYGDCRSYADYTAENPVHDHRAEQAYFARRTAWQGIVMGPRLAGS